MKFKIIKIQLKDLEHFAKSDMYNVFKTIPISINRIQSYLNNPRADKNDFVLYMAWYKDKMVGFRTILSDTIFFGNKSYRFGWFSGNWVDVEFRRKGISKMLMKEVFSDWSERLLYTNYAPNSKALYDKSKQFELLTEKQGVRLYFKLQLAELLIPRSIIFYKIRILLKITEFIINLILSPYNFIVKQCSKKYLNTIEITDKISEFQLQFISNNSKSVFKRGVNEYKWVSDYPWITFLKNDKSDYPFSSFAKQFFYKNLSLKNSNGKIEAFAIIKVKNSHLTIPFFYAKNGFNNTLANSIIGYAHKHNLSMLTCYNAQFIKSIKNSNYITFLRKQMAQKYYITKDFKNALMFDSNSIGVCDGDGDCVFT